MRITWRRCLTYHEAQDFTQGIYLHEWDAKPCYWGKAHDSYFGGNKRKRGDVSICGRYGPSYKHWIEGCLQHGAALYVGALDAEALQNIGLLETFLIRTYRSVMNATDLHQPPVLVVDHAGDVPESIRR